MDVDERIRRLLAVIEAKAKKRPPSSRDVTRLEMLKGVADWKADRERMASREYMELSTALYPLMGKGKRPTISGE
jgi:hypothetical protein